MVGIVAGKILLLTTCTTGHSTLDTSPFTLKSIDVNRWSILISAPSPSHDALTRRDMIPGTITDHFACLAEEGDIIFDQKMKSDVK